MDNNLLNNKPEESEKKSKARALLLGIIGLLALINIVLLYMYFKKNKEHETVKTELTAENTELKGYIDEAETLLEQYRQDSVALAGKNIVLSEELVAKKAEIATLVSQLKSKGNASSAEITNLRNKIQELQNQIAILEEENQVLKQEKEELTEQNVSLQTEKSKLETEKAQISEERAKYKSVAQRLQASNITVETTKKRFIDKKEVQTSKAKNVENIRIGFNINENNLADEGDRIIYVKITGPDGVTITNPGNEGGTFPYETYESKYTYKITTPFNKQAKSGPTTVWHPKGELKPGKYTIEFYSEGYKMGGSSFKLN